MKVALADEGLSIKKIQKVLELLLRFRYLLFYTEESDNLNPEHP